MGVRGLMTVCLERRAECSAVHDLVDVAKQRDGGIELLVDFYSFEHLILEHFWAGLARVSGNENVRLLGGEYAIFHEYVTKLINTLRNAGIHLVMFLDGSKGADKHSLEQKALTWEKRHHQSLQKLQDLLDVCDGYKQIEDVPESHVRPVLLEFQYIETLKDCNVELVQCQGEADILLVKCFRERQRAFAIISNDSDFAIFPQCRFVPTKLFDIANDLCLGGSANSPYTTDKLAKLECGVLSSERVAEMFQFKDSDGLIELSIVSGNDFTAPYVTNELRHKLGLRGWLLQNGIKWVKKHGNVENHPQFYLELQRNPKLAESVAHSRNFYKMLLPSWKESENSSDSGLTVYLKDAVRQGRIPSSLLAMHYGFYWHRMILEDIAHGMPCCSFALLKLRGHIYKMVLDEGQPHVKEFGKSPYKALTEIEVKPQFNRSLPKANLVDPNAVFPNLNTFSYIMTHMEDRDFKQRIKYFNRYGRKNGFTCYVLRYFLRLNYQNNLQVDLDEFLAVLATAFVGNKIDIPWYQSLGIVPMKRCVTIASWVQEIARHAFSFLGYMLNLNHEFPRPREIFSGAVFTAFYMVSAEYDMLQRQGFPQTWGDRIYFELQNVLRDQRHMTRYIVQDIFHYNPRF